MHLYPVDGAAHQVGADDTAWAYRDAVWSGVIAGIDPDPANAELIRQWSVDYWTDLHPHSMGGSYINFLGEAESAERVRATYRGHYDRLASIKAYLRPGQPVPREPEHPARPGLTARITDRTATCRTAGMTEAQCGVPRVHASTAGRSAGTAASVTILVRSQPTEGRRPRASAVATPCHQRCRLRR